MEQTNTDAWAERFGLVELLTEYLSERVLLVGAQGTVLASLGQSAGLLGFDADERDGMHVAERVHPDDLPAVLDLLARARMSDRLEESIVVQARHKDRSWRRLDVTVFSRTRDASVGAGVVRLRDVTDQPGAVELAAEQSRFVSLAEALPVGVMSGDADDFLVFANDAALVLLGTDFASLRGAGWMARIHDDHRDEVAATIAQARSQGRAASATVATAESANARWLQILVVSFTKGDRYVGWVATLEDVTARLAVERELAHRATHDALTGLPNRWLVMDRLQQALAKCARHHDGVAVVFIDIDGLKVHNDSHGHAAGDAILVEVARRLGGNVRPSDTAARIGGDEFVIISDVHSDDEARDLAQRVRALLDCQMLYGTTELAVSASVGVTFTDDATATPAQLLVDADAAMYLDKPGHGTISADRLAD